MTTYITKGGETWDIIAYNEMGNGYLMDDLIAANQAYVTTFVFSSGIELTIPDVEESSSLNLPPWFSQ